MQEQIMDILAPVVLALITALASILIVAVTQGKQLVIGWIKSRTSANQQAVIDRIAAEAYAYAEQWGGTWGEDKLKSAIFHVSNELNKAGIEVSDVKITAAVQAAWEKYGKTNK